MTNEEKIISMLQAIQTDVSGLKADVSGLKADVAEIKRTQEEHSIILEEHSVALNELIKWADDAQVVVKIPFMQPEKQ